VAAAILGQIQDEQAVGALYDLLWDENEAVHLAAAGALEMIWAERAQHMPQIDNVDALYVMTFSWAADDEELQRWLVTETLDDLVAAQPALMRAHALVMTDQSRLHEWHEQLPEGGFSFDKMVERFRSQIAAGGVDPKALNNRFFHREITSTEEPPETEAVFVYYG
jgi:hypothetical protein